MANLNRCFLMGRLTRNPEVTYTPKGTAVASMGVALNRIYKDDNGEKKEETTFIEVTAWSRQAEIATQYLKRGSSVFIEGRLQTSSWTDKQTGQKRTKLSVVAENLQLLGSKPDEAPTSRAQPAPATTFEPEDIAF
jgi:single-strand DNA-binding protein